MMWLETDMQASRLRRLKDSKTASEGLRTQRAKTVVCNRYSPGIVDFAFGLVNSVLKLPDGKVTFFGNSI